MAKPSKGFKKELYSKLSNQMPAAEKASVGLKYAAAGTLGLVLLLGGTSAYAYGSPEVSEGHFLHPIKDGIERVEGELRDGKPEGRAGHHLKMMKRRLDEADKQEFEERKAELLERASEELGLTEEELKDAMFDPERRAEIIEELDLENERFLGMIGPPPHMMPPEVSERMHEKGGDIMENEDLSWDEKRNQMHERMRAHWEEMNQE